MKVSEHFDLREFIDPITYDEYGDKSIDFIDARLFAIAEKLRELTGKSVAINNYSYGGNRHESGLRRQDSPTGAKHSAHKEGKAIDCVVTDWNAKDVHALVLSNEKTFYDLGVRQMEDITFSPSWTHLSTRVGINNGRIQIIKP